MAVILHYRWVVDKLSSTRHKDVLLKFVLLSLKLSHVFLTLHKPGRRGNIKLPQAEGSEIIVLQTVDAWAHLVILYSATAFVSSF